MSWPCRWLSKSHERLRVTLYPMAFHEHNYAAVNSRRVGRGYVVTYECTESAGEAWGCGDSYEQYEEEITISDDEDEG